MESADRSIGFPTPIASFCGALFIDVRLCLSAGINGRLHAYCAMLCHHNQAVFWQHSHDSKTTEIAEFVLCSLLLESISSLLACYGWSGAISATMKKNISSLDFATLFHA